MDPISTIPGTRDFLPGSATLIDWVIEKPVQLIGYQNWKSQSGYYHLILGRISQTVATLPNTRYLVTFYMAAHGDASSMGKQFVSLTLSFGSQMTTFTFNTQGKSRTNIGWELKTFEFFATSSSTIIQFEALDEFPLAAMIDDVTVIPSGSFECFSKPCLNGGICSIEVNSYTCICPTGFSGQRCEIGIFF